MILTLTVNPAVDQTMWVPRFVAGVVNRPREAQLDPAGKGVNVSRMAKRLGAPTLALGFVAGDVGRVIERRLDEERVQNHFVRIAGQSRIDVTIVDEATGTSTSLYAPGPTVDALALAQLDEMVDGWLGAGRVLVLAGSLPAGVPVDAYARWTTLARGRGVKVILDGDGEAMRLGTAARPDVVKPNVEEAERLLGRRLDGERAIVDGARALVAGGVGAAVISMGAGGAICTAGGRTWRVRPPRVERRSSVGSGDSLVAGVAIALARGDAFVDGLKLGTAAGAATAMSPGTSLGAAADVERLLGRVEVEEIF